MPDPLDTLPETVKRDMKRQQDGDRRGQVSVFTCPGCGGSLWQSDESGPGLRFRCHVGHAYHAAALLQEQTEALEAALWTAVRTFREKAVLARQLAAQNRASNPARSTRFEDDAALAERYGELIHEILLRPPVKQGEPAA